MSSVLQSDIKWFGQTKALENGEIIQFGIQFLPQAMLPSGAFLILE